ncbi:MAG: hypothetical protein F4133_14795 [Gammaproteobacteria bacterium]|nr:hypothetical protein [Gammaproteobacteria bacterium]
MSVKARFLFQIMAVIAFAGCTNADDNDDVVIDGMVRVTAGDSYVFVVESMDMEERQANVDIMLEFAVDFEEMFGMAPTPYTFILYDTDDIHWFKDAVKFQQPGTQWTFGFGSVTFFDETYKAYLAELAKDYPDQDLGAGADYEFNYETFRPIVKHELTHFALYNTLYSGDDVPLDWSTSAPYHGDPIPDALDDGMADYLTTEAHRQSRRDVFQQHKEAGFEFLPLAELFEVKNIWHKKKNTDKIEGIETEIPGVAPEEIQYNHVLMYNQGFMVFEFIFELGGMEFFRHMIAGYKEYKDMDQILAEYGGKGGMPTSLADLDRLWWESLEATE